jgi:hypothetical protein
MNSLSACASVFKHRSQPISPEREPGELHMELNSIYFVPRCQCPLRRAEGIHQTALLSDQSMPPFAGAHFTILLMGCRVS